MELKYINHEDFEIDPEGFGVYTGKLEKAIETLNGELNVVFVNDTYIRALNKSYRSKDMPTDVLSFNYEASDDSEALLGEVYISVDTARRQAVDHKHSLEDELIKLIVHGILHIHGHDHEENEEYKKMYAIEKKVLGDIAGEMVL